MGIDQPQQPDRTLNRYGLPEGWAYEQSKYAMEELRKMILEENNLDIKDALDKLYVHIMNTSKDLPGTRNHNAHISVDDPSPRYFSKNWDEKIQSFYTNWPQGCRLMGTQPVRYLKWEYILPCELWAIHNHGGQTIFDRARRGGYAPQEIAAIFYATDRLQISSTAEQLIAYWEQHGMMAN